MGVERPQRPRAVGEGEGELKTLIQLLHILPAFPPSAGMQEEWVGLRVVARLALHQLHHPDELDGVVMENLGQSN